MLPMNWKRKVQQNSLKKCKIIFIIVEWTKKNRRTMEIGKVKQRNIVTESNSSKTSK
jgi:hypothetical protein